jgi:hypothetical protein
VTVPGRGAAHRAIGIRDKRRRDPSRSYEPNRQRRDRMSTTVKDVISRADVLGVYGRPDGEIGAEIRKNVIPCVEPATVTGESKPARPTDGGIAA